MATTLRLVLADQLSMTLASMRNCDKQNDLVLMAEVKTEASYVKHHKKKIAFLFSAMRHFAAELRDDNYQVRYIKYDDIDNQGSLFKEVKRAIQNKPFDKVELTFPGEFRVLEDFRSWQKELDIPVVILEDDRFLSKLDDFSTWAKDKKQLRMEFFYRKIRQSTMTLMEGEEPSGGKWNYDSANRNAMNSDVKIPAIHNLNQML